MDITTTKIVVALLFGLIRFLFGILPIKIQVWLNIKKTKHKESVIECVIVIVQAFGGGVLFATCFLHMMPEVSNFVADLKEYGVFEKDYPFSLLIISVGFFTIYFTEELCQWLITRSPKKKEEEEEEEITNKDIEQERKSAKIANGFAFEVKSTEPNNTVNEEKYYPEDSDSVADTVDQGIQTESKDSDRESVLNIEGNLDVPSDINAEIEEFIEDDGKTQRQMLRCFFVIIALSLHSIFEGLAIGLQRSIKNIWFLFIAVSIHSATVLYMIGSEIVASGTSSKTIMIHMCMLSATTPFGVLLGLLITLTTNFDTSAKSFALVVLEGLSTGTILYITFFETLRREKERRKWRATRAVFIASGFTLMAILQGFGLGN